MGNARSFYYLCLLELDEPIAEIIEQSHTTTQQHGYYMKPYLVKQSRLDVLLSDIRTADQIDILVARGIPRLPQRAFDAIGHKRKWCCSFRYTRGSLMGQDKYRHSIQGMAAAPSIY